MTETVQEYAEAYVDELAKLSVTELVHRVKNDLKALLGRWPHSDEELLVIRAVKEARKAKL